MKRIKAGDLILIHEVEPLDIITILPDTMFLGKCLVYKVDNDNLYIITNIDNDKESMVRTFSKSNTGFVITFEGSIPNIKPSVFSEVLERKFDEMDTNLLRFKDLRCGAKFSFEKKLRGICKN